ncbi:hypothetical protein GX441_10515 [bacterium]|nr:hypothetical protein [bacterium]
MEGIENNRAQAVTAGKKKGRGVLLRFSAVASAALFALALGLASFTFGYTLALSKISGIWSETSVLKAKSAELENELLHLKNYAVLIDAIASQGGAAEKLNSSSRTEQGSVKTETSD